MFTIFSLCILHAKMNIFYFLNGIHHLLNHNLNLKNIHLPCFVHIPSVFIKFLIFPVFSMSGKIDNQIPCFPCAVATLSVVHHPMYHSKFLKQKPLVIPFKEFEKCYLRRKNTCYMFQLVTPISHDWLQYTKLKFLK